MSKGQCVGGNCKSCPKMGNDPDCPHKRVSEEQHDKMYREEANHWNLKSLRSLGAAR